MTSLEQTGKTIEDATQKALAQLSVTEDEVDVEILEEAGRGFLGLGQSPAKVRVTLKQRPVAVAAPKPPARERRPRQRQAPREDRPRERPAPVEERPKRKPAPREQQPRERAGAKEERPPQKAAPQEEQPRQKPAPREQRQRRRPAAPQEPQKEKLPAPAPEPVPPTAPEPVAAVPMEEILKSAAEISLEALQHIADGIEEGAKAAVKSAADGQIVLEIRSAEPAVIIGKHGQTIDAIQYLVGIITNRRLPEKVRVVVDVEGYRSRREEALTNQALYLSSKVKETGEEAVLDPLHANERRIIHTALADDPDVYTYSEGEEPERYVVISPKK